MSIRGFDVEKPYRNELNKVDEPKHDEDPETSGFDDIRCRSLLACIFVDEIKSYDNAKDGTAF